jgi:hypothetical protein
MSIFPTNLLYATNFGLSIPCHKTYHTPLQFCLTISMALVDPTLNLNFSVHHMLFVIENIISTDAVLPGRQRINSTLQKS